MKKSIIAVVALAALAIAVALPLFAADQTWSNVSLIDQKCSTRFKPDTADTHTLSCAMACASSGFGILTSDGTFLMFDKDGSQKATNALKASTQKDHIRATVTGALDGKTIKVSSIKLD
jgi:VCBS repeat-containing protein